MKSAVIAAVVAAIVSAGAASAGTAWINGAAIRPGTIRISRLAPGAIEKLRGQQGPVGPQGPAGPQGPSGEPSDPGQLPVSMTGWLCVNSDGSLSWTVNRLQFTAPCAAGARGYEIQFLALYPKSM